MLRAVVPVFLFSLLALSAPAQDGGYPMPWPDRLRPRPTVLDILEELAAPEVSGPELAAVAEAVLRRWQKHEQERKRAAESLAALAAAFEKEREFVKALALYESLWVEFPERQDLIGKIKREHALADLDIDVSTPQEAFLSLKRALLTYKVTAPTFGITDLDTPIYEPGPVERHEWDAYGQELEQRLTELEEETTSPVEEEPAPVIPECIGLQLLIDLEKPITVDFKDTPWPDVIEHVAELSGIPIVLSKEAERILPDEPITVSLENAPAKLVLKYVLRFRNLRYIRRNFSLLVVPIGPAVDQYATLIMQQEPVDHFPEYAGSASQEFPVGDTSFFLSAFDRDEVPADWFVRKADFSYTSLITAPADVVGLWSHVCTTGETGRFYGRVLPLFRCMRRYPLPGPFVHRDVRHPKKVYVFRVQLAREVQAMQAFLDDREAVISILAAQLEGTTEHEPNRFVPRFSFPVESRLAARVGLWLDGQAYHFLLFDSEQDRARWLKGEDWVDMPSDLDDYEWPTEEEWQRTLEEMERESERLPDQSD